MAAPRVAMRNIKECLRLKFEAGLSHEKIARALQLSKGVVSKYIAAARVAGLDWPALVAMDEAALAAALFAPTSTNKPRGERVLPDVLSIHRELRRKGVTLQRMRLGIPSCVTKPVATYAAAAPQSHLPAASAGA